MKISLNWLQDFVTLKTKDFDLIQERITNRSAEIEEVIKEGDLFNKVVVGEILEIKKHPDADKLNVTQTTTGEHTFQIICGAQNIKVGQKVPVSLIGAKLPNGLKIQKTKIRGIESQGMICSETELGIAEESKGIWELPNDAKVGMPLAEFLGMNDVTLDIDNTAITNRADLFSHIGFANEFVANDLAEQKKQPELKIPESKNKFPIEIKIQDPEACPVYTTVVMKNITVQASPEWMQKRLRAVGIRPINNIVDITNYVMMELGMPTHAFDLKKIQGKKIIMRKSNKQDKITTLDSIERELPEGIIVLEDKQKIFDLCGIMGGENSEIDQSTKTILLHTPIYDPILVRKAMLSLAHRTDASTMYEKGVPYIRSIQGIKKAIGLILEFLPESKIDSEILSLNSLKAEERIIDLPKSEIKRVLNTDISEEKVCKILTDLGFEVKILQKEYQVKVPPERFGDITAKHDLIEEIVRIYDVNTLPGVLPITSIQPTQPNTSRLLERKIKNKLAEIGFNEILTYTFIGPELYSKVGVEVTNEVIEVANPISQDISLMQTSLLPSLMENVEKNSRYQESFNIFEFGRAFFKTSQTEHREEKHIAGAMVNNGFYALKGKVEALFKSLGLTPRYVNVNNIEKFMHPGRSCDILVGKDIVGYISEINPQVIQNFDIEKTVNVFEINFTKILEAKQRKKTYKPISKYPHIKLDISILIDQKIPAENLLRVIKKTDQLIYSAEIIDLYEGKQIPEGKKSLTFSIIYQSLEKTLTDADIEMIHQKVIINLEKQGAEIRR